MIPLRAKTLTELQDELAEWAIANSPGLATQINDVQLLQEIHKLLVFHGEPAARIKIFDSYGSLSGYSLPQQYTKSALGLMCDRLSDCELLIFRDYLRSLPKPRQEIIASQPKYEYEQLEVA